MRPIPPTTGRASLRRASRSRWRWLLVGYWKDSRNRGGFIEEEDATHPVAAARDRPLGRPAVQPAVDARPPVAAECARAGAFVRLAVRADEPPRLRDQPAASIASKACLASGPPRYSPKVPSLRTTRWHGRTSGSGFCEHALAAARTADGLPAAFATAV